MQACSTARDVRTARHRSVPTTADPLSDSLSAFSCPTIHCRILPAPPRLYSRDLWGFATNDKSERYLTQGTRHARKRHETSPAENRVELGLVNSRSHPLLAPALLPINRPFALSENAHVNREKAVALLGDRPRSYPRCYKSNVA